MYKFYKPALDRKDKYVNRSMTNKIVVHCSDSDVPSHDNPRVIDDWHKERGWTGIGYHFVITKEDGVWSCRPEMVVGSHCYGYNFESIGICLTGRHKFTEFQFEELAILLKNLCYKHDIKNKDVFGHYELDEKKTCPNFDMDKFRLRLKK